MPEYSAVRRVPVRGTPQLTRVIHAFQDAGVVVTRGPESFDIACPCHAEEEPSCTVSDGDYGVVLNCHAACAQADVFRAAVEVTGLRPQDFFYESRFSGALATSSAPLTIPLLADAKHLPSSDLISHGVRESPQGLRIPYWDQEGNLFATRVRFGLVAHRGSCWDRRGTKVSPYGAWRVPSYRRGQTLFVVEGESDCWTGWHYNLPVVGIPGKTHARRAFLNAPGLLRGFVEIVVVEEPDDRDDGVLVRGVRRALSDTGSAAELFVMRLPVKDVSDLHVQMGPESFISEFARAHQIACDAATWDPPGPVPPDATRIARWVQRSRKATFTSRDVRDGSKREWAEVRGGLSALVTAGWLRELPSPRRPGKPERRYRRNPHLQTGAGPRTGQIVHPSGR